MANLRYTSEILDNALFTAHEPTNGASDYETQSLIWLNSVYRDICSGGTALDPDFDEDWIWLRSHTTMTLRPYIETGTVSVTNNSTSITFSSAPTLSVSGYHFKTSTNEDIFKVSSHTASSTSATLDSVYTGDTGTADLYKLAKLEYTLPETDILEILKPVRIYKASLKEVSVVEFQALEQAYPLARFSLGSPKLCALIDANTLRFSHGGDDEDLSRVDFHYKKLATDLTDNAAEEPLVPIEFRKILSDYTAYYILEDKSDADADRIGQRARAGLMSMAKDNRRRMTRAGRNVGQIFPRQGKLRRNFLRTDSGIIVG